MNRTQALFCGWHGWCICATLRLVVQSILFTFVGNRDPYRDGVGIGSGEESEPGPVLSLLGAREFSTVILFCTGSEYIERARSVEEIARGEGYAAHFKFVSIDLESPVDYAEIFRKLTDSLAKIQSTFKHTPHRLSILLDPGTPQMQTAWFLFVASGRLDAQLLQGVPPRFAGGAYKVRELDLSRDLFPGIQITDAPRSATSPRWTPSDPPVIIGSSKRFLTALEGASKVARYDVSVMIRGETGTGKEVIARKIHDESARSREPFVAVNCASIAATLAESELFGHEKGAFTGADRARLGQFRAADGGTIFLDEIGDLPSETQAKLLRVLESREVTPVGSDTATRVDVRIIAATNRDLDSRIAQEAFRRDLYERLAQVTISIPPLRERSDDIALLVEHFVSRWNERYREQKGISDEALAYLIGYPWPGNVRELSNAVSSMCAMGVSVSIGAELLPPSIRQHFGDSAARGPINAELPAEGLDLRAVLHNVERSYYEQALERSEGNAEAAAKLLGLQGPAFRKAARERLGIQWRG